jgi:hypothetical protein
MTLSTSSAIQRVRPEMRSWFLIDSFLVFVTGIQCFLLSEFTARFFAWTINPPLTAAFLGASYWAALPLVFLAAQETVWARARIAVYGVLVFTSLTTIATLLHLDRFHLNSPELLARLAAYAWLVVYIVVPPTLLALLWRQRAVPGGDPPRVAPLPSWVRGVFGLWALLMIPFGTLLSIAPATFAPIWPWMLTPLTARAVGAWLVGIGIICAQAAWENDWLRLRGTMPGLALLGALQLIALARFPTTVNWANPLAWLYVAVLISLLVVGGYGWWRTRLSSDGTGIVPVAVHHSEH